MLHNYALHIMVYKQCEGIRVGVLTGGVEIECVMKPSLPHLYASIRKKEASFYIETPPLRNTVKIQTDSIIIQKCFFT